MDDITGVSRARPQATAEAELDDTLHDWDVATTSPRVPHGPRLPDLTAADLTIVPASQASFEDVKAAFGVRGYASTCQCQRFKLRPYQWRESSVAVRQERLRRETHCDSPSSLTTSGLEVLRASLRRVVMRIDFEPDGRPPDPQPSTKPQGRRP